MPGEGPGLRARRGLQGVQRPNMRFVPAKSVEQQSRLMVHRARQGFVGARTATINRDCCSSVLTGTKRMLGRGTASPLL